jgi:drug/metabolite transporter (DMT)-like permease
VLFTVSSVVSLLLAAAVSVTAFGEKRSLAWYATVGLAVAAVVLVSARGLGR